MAELRELTTRFGFDVDRSGVQKFNSAITGMRRQITGLAGVFGVGIGGRQLLETAKSAEQAEAALRGATAGFPGGAELVIESIKKVQAELDGLKEGAGQIITPAEGKAIGASFFGAFEDFSKEGFATFETFLSSALKLSLQTGAEVTQVFSAIQQSAISGSIDPLRQLPGITETIVRQFQFLTGLIDGVDPTGVTQLAINVDRVRDALESANPAVDNFIKNLPNGLLAVRRTGKEVEEGFQNLSQTIIKALAEPIKLISEFVGQLNEGVSASDALSNALKNIDVPPAVRTALELAGLLPEEEPTPPDIEKGERIGERIGRVSKEFREFKSDIDRSVAPLIQAGEKIDRAVLGFFGLQSDGQGQQAINQPRNAIVQVPGQVAPIVPVQPSVAPVGEDKTFTIRVIHEGNVTTFADINEARDAFGDLLDQATVEFVRAETTP